MLSRCQTDRQDSDERQGCRDDARSRRQARMPPRPFPQALGGQGLAGVLKRQMIDVPAEVLLQIPR
jgi:hypothetical protein